MFQFTLKMYLPGVIIVMFQHKVHKNRNYNKSKLHIDFSHSIIQRKFNISLSNIAQKLIVCKLINKIFLFTIDRFNKCMEFVDI